MAPYKIKYKRDVKLWPVADGGALFLNNVKKTTISPVGVSASTQKYLDALRNYDNQHAYANRVTTSFSTGRVFVRIYCRMHFCAYLRQQIYTMLTANQSDPLLLNYHEASLTIALLHNDMNEGNK